MKGTLVGKVRIVTEVRFGIPIASQVMKLYRYKASDWNTKYPVEPCESENYELIRKVMPKGQRIHLSRSSVVEFDDDVTFSVFQYVGPPRPYVWMSDTPLELDGHKPALRQAQGRVLIGGLGMGWVAHQMSLKKSVKEIVIVEKDREIIDLLYPRLKPHFGCKVEVVNEDLFEYKSRKRFDAAWFDIWEHHDDFQCDMRKLVHKFKSTVPPERMRFWDERRVRGPSAVEIAAQQAVFKYEEVG